MTAAVPARSYICAALTSPAFTLVPLVAVVWGISPLSLNPKFAVAFPIYIASMHAGRQACLPNAGSGVRLSMPEYAHLNGSSAAHAAGLWVLARWCQSCWGNLPLKSKVDGTCPLAS